MDLGSRKLFGFRIRRSVWIIVALLLDGAITAITLRFSTFVRRALPETANLLPVTAIDIPEWFLIVAILVWLASLMLASSYDLRRFTANQFTDQLVSVLYGSGTATVLLAGLLYLTIRDTPRWMFIIFVVLNTAMLLMWRILTRPFVQAQFVSQFQRRVLIVGAGRGIHEMDAALSSFRSMGLHIVGYLHNGDEDSRDLSMPRLGVLRDCRMVVRECEIDDVVLASSPELENVLDKLLADLSQLPVRVFMIPGFHTLVQMWAPIEGFGGIAMLNLRKSPLNPFQRFVKRAADFFFALLTLFLSAPLLLLVSVLIRLDTRGPVLFRQRRVGENGRLFTMYKFRTMVENAEQLQAMVNTTNSHGEVIHKQEDDPRVTRVGRLLRRTSLDEMPQLLNVLKGEMSLVGPRPELPWLVAKYEPWQQGRFWVPQGITGWWQINGRSDRPLHLHTEDDLFYIQNYSFWMDLYILLKTPLVVLRGRGAY